MCVSSENKEEIKIIKQNKNKEHELNEHFNDGWWSARRRCYE